MSEPTLLRYGGLEAEFRKSPTQTAVQPRFGRGRILDFALDGLLRRLPAERRGRLGHFEIVDIHSPPAVIEDERHRLSRTNAVARSVAVYHTSNDEVPFVPEGTLFLSFEEGAKSQAVDEVLARYELAIVSQSHGFYTVHSSNPDTVQVAAELQRDPAVAIAEPDMLTPRRLFQTLPDDALLSQQWHLENRGQIASSTAGLREGADARVVAAWRRLGNLGAPDAVIAVIDDGFDLTHPDFLDKTVHPWDFGRGNENVQPEPDYFAASAGDWHGTACAGVAAALPGGLEASSASLRMPSCCLSG
jgi:subtilisin family serine protease